MRYVCLVMMALLVAAENFAGTITGTVRAKGPELDESGGGDRYASRKFKFAERINYDAMRDFVVYIDQPVPEVSEGKEKRVAVVKQKHATFDPHVLPVVAGTTVEWPNNDDIYHNVFSFSDAKQFDLGLYKRNDRPREWPAFDDPGRVDVFCSIHKDMHCIVLVLENPFFAKTDNRNRYTIENVPPGVYQVRAWHERMPSQAREITVPAEGEVNVDFVLGFSESK